MWNGSTHTRIIEFFILVALVTVGCLGMLVPTSRVMTIVPGPFAVAAADFSACTKTWGASASGSWHVGTNWAEGAVPGPSDVVCIPGGKSVTYSTGATTIASLQSDVGSTFTMSQGTLTLAGGSVPATSHVDGAMLLTGGTLNGDGQLEVNGALTWSGTTIGGGAASGNELAVANGPVTMNGPVATLDGRTLQVAGTATQTGAGAYNVRNGAILEILPGGTLDIRGTDLSFNSPAFATGTGGGTILNRNIIKRTTSTGSATIVGLENTSTGQVRAESGTFTIRAGGTNDGAIIQAGGALQFMSAFGGIFNNTPGSSISGTNVTFFAVSGFGGGGTVNIAGTYNVTGTTQILDGGSVAPVVNFTGPVTSVGALTVKGSNADFRTGGTITLPALTVTFGGGSSISGILSGSDPIVVNGPFTWGGNAIRGDSNAADGNETLVANAGATFNGGGVLDGRTIQIAGGTAVKTNNLGYTLINGALIDVSPGVTFDIQGSEAVGQPSFTVGGGGGTFRNAGLLKRTANTGTATVTNLVNTSTGEVRVESGFLTVRGGGSNDGTMLSAGGTLQFFPAAGVFTSSPGASIGGTDVVFFGVSGTGGGTVNIQGTYNVSGTTQLLDGSSTAPTVNFTGPVSSVGALTVRGSIADFQTGGTITLPALNLIGSGGIGGALGGTDPIIVNGVFTWDGNALRGDGDTTNGNEVLVANGGATLNSGITANTAASLIGRTLRIAGGTAVKTSTGSYSLSSGALIDILAGAVLDIQGNDGVSSTFRNFGGTVQNAGTIQRTVGTGAVTIEPPVTNAGLLDVRSGTLRLSGAYAQSAGATQVNGGVLDPNGPFAIQGGLLRGSGDILGPVAVSGSGETSPGLSIGDLNVTGTYVHSAGGGYTVEIGPTATNVDRLDVSGTATLGGTLKISLVGGFAPQASDTFVIMTYGSRTGTFAQVDAPPLPGGGTFDVQYNATNVTLVVTSVPTATPTATHTPTSEPTATSTLEPTTTYTPTLVPTITSTPTATNTLVPTITNTPVPTATNTPVPTATNTPSVSYQFTGFSQPVDNLPTVNRANAGRAIPVKFSLNGNRGLDIFAEGYPNSAPLASCTTTGDPIEETVTAGSSSLTYDAGSDRYTYVWKTDNAWRGCRQLTVKFKDGQVQVAAFDFIR